jgi:hypothetical protein
VTAQEEKVARVMATLFSRVDPRKTQQISALLDVLGPLCRGRAREHVIVDVACGKSYLLHALHAVLAPRARYIGVDRDARLVARCGAAAAELDMPAEFRTGRIADVVLPDRPDVLVALHACGPASDEAIARAIALGARHALIVPCCHARPPRDSPRPPGFPNHGLLRGRLDDLLIDATRTLTLEAAGFEVTAVEFVAARDTAHNLLLRARHVGATGRAERARADLAALDAWIPGKRADPVIG